MCGKVFIPNVRNKYVVTASGLCYNAQHRCLVIIRAWPEIHFERFSNI